VLIVFGALTYPQLRRAHIRVELVYTHLRPRARAAADVLADAAGLVFFGLLLWQATNEAQYSYQINERMSLNQEASFATPLGEVNDFIFNFKAALVSNLSHALDLSVRYEVEFDNSLEDESREDQRVISSLGYKF